jgi:hypothetical protein
VVVLLPRVVVFFPGVMIILSGVVVIPPTSHSRLRSPTNGQDQGVQEQSDENIFI